MTTEVDFYELLECERTADDATLKASYRKLAMKYHPDKNDGCKDSEAKTAVEGGDSAAMTEKAQALAQVAMKLGQAIYEKEQASGASPGAGVAPGGEGGHGDDVVDAEFSEVDDNK